jgi:DNA (cytosine-5)-methyltransferase 1
LAEATMRRIARGVQRFVIDAAKPFIVNTRNGERGGQQPRVRGIDEPAWTITGEGSQGALVAPVLTEHANASRAASWRADEPLRTQCAEVKGGHFALVSAFLEQANGGFYDGPGRGVEEPAGTVCAQGSMQRLVTSNLVKLRGDNVGSPTDTPLHTVSAQGFHHAEVRAFLIAYYGNEKDGRECAEPMGTVVSRERFGLVTVDGTDYAIADIGLRMLTPRELFRAQGFPETYVIDRGANGRKLPKDAQVRACGNSVCPPLARALVAANLGELIDLYARAAA